MAMGFNQRPLSDWLDRDPHKEHFCFWDEVCDMDLSAYSRTLESAMCEQDLQNYFEEWPIMLIQHLGGGHGRWVIPQKALGCEYQTDFLISDRDSLGRNWFAVELESPFKRAFKTNGDPTYELTHAMQQIRNWRSWLRDNIDYATRPKERNGLALEEITPDLPGLIIIGRRNEEPDSNRLRRRDLGKEANMLIHSYDWIYERAYDRADNLGHISERFHSNDSNLP